MTPLDANRTPNNKPFTSRLILNKLRLFIFLTPADKADTLRVLDLHVCHRLDPTETIGTRGVRGYGHLELIGIATSGDVLVAAGSKKRWR